MKKLLFTFLLLTPFALALNAADDEEGYDSVDQIIRDREPVIAQIIKFKEMEKGHKDRWLDFAKKVHDDKFNLLKKHHDQWTDLHVRHLKMLKNNIITKDVLEGKLQDMISLHENQIGDWKQWHDNMNKNAMNTAHKNSQELEKFKAGLRK
jgi:hypothetical protein